jgi:hypothetical protein
LAKEAKFAEKDSNKCKVTAEEDLVLSIQFSAKRKLQSIDRSFVGKVRQQNKTIQKRLKLRIKTLKQNNCLYIKFYIKI